MYKILNILNKKASIRVNLWFWLSTRVELQNGLIMKNKANFAEGEMSVCSLKTIHYGDFVPFVTEKNKANFWQTQEKGLEIQKAKTEIN